MTSKATTVAQYLAELPEERRAAISAVREVILRNLPQGVVEEMSYGMLGYVIPHSIYPPGYHCDPKLPLPFVNLASQKNHMSLYMMCYYGSVKMQEWMAGAFQAHGKKLDAGKGCIRFKKLSDLPLEVIGEAVGRLSVADYILQYEAAIPAEKRARKKR